MGVDDMQSRSMTAKISQRIAACAIALIVGGVLTAWLLPSHGHATTANVPSTAEFCISAPAEAHADLKEAAAVVLNATVPLQTPAFGEVLSSHVPVSKGDVVRISVNSPRDGGIAVHGLLDVQPIRANEHITAEFRAIYSGRFPIHFHGADGSHFEIAALEVLPHAPTPSTQPQR